MIHDAAVAIEQLDEGLPRLRIDEARRLRTAGRGSRRRPADSRRSPSDADWRRASTGAVGAEGAHVDTLAHGLEQTREREVALVQARLLLRGWCRCRRPAGGVARRPTAFDRGANRRRRRRPSVELHRLARDVDADRAAEAVRVPLEHVALRVATRDEARLVGLVTLLAAAAIARHVLQDLRDAARRSRRSRERCPSAAPARSRRSAAAAPTLARRGGLALSGSCALRSVRRTAPPTSSAASPGLPATTTVVIRPRPANPSRNVNGASASDSCPQFIPAGVGYAEPPMRFFGRQDLLLIAALTTALVIVFSSSISRVLDYAREIERQSGLTLMPALVLADRRLLLPSIPPQPSAAGEGGSGRCWRRKEAEHRAEELERLVAFGQALGASLDFDSIRVAIGQHLPRDRRHRQRVGARAAGLRVAGADRRHARRGGSAQWGDLAEQLLASGRRPRRRARR